MAIVIMVAAGAGLALVIGYALLYRYSARWDEDE
jgi:hypothetical protein